MGRTFTREQLESKTSKDLKRMCVDELGISGVTKKSKDVVINAIMAKYGAHQCSCTAAPTPSKETPLSGVAFTGHSVMTKPEAKFGDRTTTTIQVSCGANTGTFPVAGRTVAAVGEFLREVMNVDKLSTGLVNGKEVGGDYILKPGDTLEYLKPAGSKGC